MRNTFIVTAQIIDKNGFVHILDGFPQIVDSKTYDGDVDKARRMADAVFSETWAAMCRDNNSRQIQTVFVTDIYGNQLDRKSMGTYVEAEPEPTEPEVTEGE